MKIKFAEIADGDLPIMERWLHADHVRRAWGEPEKNIHLLRASPAAGHRRAIIEADGRKVGLLLWQHPGRRELDEAGLTDIPETVVDVDIMIGEPTETGRGIGSAALRMVTELALADPTVPFVMAAVLVENGASRRAFAKAGFQHDREFHESIDANDVSSGHYVLMVRRRPHKENE